MVELNKGQAKAFKRAISGENLFITGVGGTGKSFLLKTLVNELKQRYTKGKVQVTALTGLAAIGIDGKTLHSFAGMGHDLSREPESNLFVMRRWKNTKVLIIDEVSMLTREFFEKVYRLAKKFKIQLILFGDFLQLPPVNINGEEKNLPCFTSPKWKEAGLRGKGTIILNEVVRQKDKDFIKVLNEIRMGDISRESKDYLIELSKKGKPSEDKLTKIYPINRSVNSENLAKLKMIPSEEIILTSKDKTNTSRPHKALLQMLNKEAPQEIVIKVGARVMLTRNRTGSILVNGSIGEVVGISATKDPFVTFECMPNAPILIERIDYEVKMGKDKLTRSQYPLKLAWSNTAHKIQGMTLHKILASVSDSFEKGQIYTILSRVTTPEGLYIDDVDVILEKNKVCELAKKYYKEHQLCNIFNKIKT